jgi:hypothetical protein
MDFATHRRPLKGARYSSSSIMHPTVLLLKVSGRRSIGGLGVNEVQVLLAPKQLDGSTKDWATLNERFGGNGLALKVVGETSESSSAVRSVPSCGWIRVAPAAFSAAFGGSWLNRWIAARHSNSKCFACSQSNASR